MARLAKRGLLRAAEPHRSIVQRLAVDEFGEVATRKRAAGKAALDLNHQLGPWRRRKNDEYGRWDSWCTDCNAMATVAVEQPPNLDLLYGKALTTRCGVGTEDA